MSDFLKHYGDEETLIFVSDADMWADFNGATKTAHGSPALCQRCDTNNPDDNGHTAFYIVVHHGHAGVVRMLLSFTVSVSVRARECELASGPSCW